MSGGSVKERLLAWTLSPELPIDPVARFILYRWAHFADQDCCGWAKIETLAGDVGCSERSVQRRLRELEEKGLIKPTGRSHTLKRAPGKAARTVPIYQFAPEVEGLGKPESMGDNLSPMPGAWVTPQTSMGDNCVTPHKGHEGVDERSNDLSTRARARELRSTFEELEAAYPRLGLGFTDQGLAWAAFLDLAEAGVDVARLPDAARRYGADPVLRKRDYGPVGLQRWLSEGRYRAWVDDPAAAAGPPAPPSWVGPPELRADLPPDVALAYLDRASWDAERRLCTAATGIAFDRLRPFAAVFAKHNVTLAPPGPR